MKNKHLMQYMGKIFLSFFLVVGVPLLCMTGYFLHNVQTKWADHDYKQHHMELAEQIRDLQAFSACADEFMSVTAKSSDFRTLLKQDYKDAVYYYAQLQQLMLAFRNASFHPDVEFGVYIGGAQKVLSTLYPVNSLENYPDGTVIEEFLAQESLSDYAIRDHYLLKCAALPGYYYQKNAVGLCYLELDSWLRPSGEGASCVLLPDGELLYGAAVPAGLGEHLMQETGRSADNPGYCKLEQTEVWYKTDPLSGLTIAHISDHSTMNHVVLKYVMLSFAAFSCSLICATIISVLMTMHYTRPVKKLSEQLEQLPDVHVENTTIFEAFYSSMAKLQADNETYHQRVEQSKGAMREQMVRDLIWNRVPIHDSMQDYMAEKGFESGIQYLQPILVQIDVTTELVGVNRLAEINTLVREVIMEALKDEQLIGSSQLGSNELVFLLGKQEIPQEELLRGQMEKCMEFIREKTGIRGKMVLGYEVDTAEELCKQFVFMRRQAYQYFKVDHVECVKKSRRMQTHLSPHLHTTLLNAIRSGREDDVRKTVCYIFQTAEKEQNQVLVQNFLFAVFGNILSYLFDFPVDMSDSQLDLLEAFAPGRKPEEQKQILLEKLLVITKKFEATSQSTGTMEDQSNYVQRAQAYMDQTYYKNIPITEIADHLGINVSYFGRIFKEEVGMTPLQYITKMRIDKAKQLMADGKYTIKEVAEQVGYNDTRSFARFFKKLEGCSPSEFRADSAPTEHVLELEPDEND